MGKSKVTELIKDELSKKVLKPKNIISKKPKKETESKEGTQETFENESYFGDKISTSNPSHRGLITHWNIKLVSWNINGVRAWIKGKGLDYVLEENADIIALQETKCSQSDLPEQAKSLKDYHSFWSSAEKPGYAGTGLYSRNRPINVKYGIGVEIHDVEGRTITAEYENFFLVSVYVPNSGRGLVRLDYRKSSWDIDFTNYLKELDKTKPIIVCGDLNVSHQEIDLTNPKSNSRTAGFTKEERAGFTSMLESVNLIDSFRHIYPNRTGAYSFWSNMRNSRARNIGWRLDYFLISSRLLPHLCNQELRTGVMGSDHCPVVLYLKF